MMLILYFCLVLLCGDIDALRNENGFSTDDLCEPNYCGIQANCERGRDEHGIAIPICSCPLGFVGNPNVTCVRGLCLHDDDCLDHLYCDEHLCKNPCTVLTCAHYALCTITNHRAKCSCPYGYEGNPTEVCRYSPEQPSIQNLPDDLCTPNPCGVNAHCLYGKDQLGNSIPATCSCPQEYYGNASIVCHRKECQDNNDCPANLACQAYLCTNPCTVSTCATFAACRVNKHQAVCSCPLGHDGDPWQECVYRLIKDTPIGATSLKNILEEKMKEMFKTNDRQIIIANQESLGKIVELLQSTNVNVETLKKEIEKQVEINKNEILKSVKRLAYGLWKGRWIEVCIGTMNYATAVKCCEDKNATVFHPKTKEDHEYMQDFRASTGGPVIFYPIHDSIDEGTFVWQDGTAVSKKDEQNITWAQGKVYQGHDTDEDKEVRNCGVMDAHGVFIAPCNAGTSGIMCTAEG